MKRMNWLGVAVVALALGALFIAVSRTHPDARTLEILDGGTFAAAPAPPEEQTLQALRARAARMDAGAIPLAEPKGQGSALAKFGWGSGSGQLGKDVPQEGNPEAPMSLAPAPGGGAWVLDQVNNRLVKLDKDGKVEATQNLTLQGAQDMAVGKDGTVAVMDRLLDKQVALFSADGKPLGALPVEGKNLENGGTASGVFIDGEEVFVEREHGDLVKIGDKSGKADADRGEVPGRPSRDGSAWLTAMITSMPEGRVSLTVIDRPSRQLRYTRELRLGTEVYGLNLLDSDLAGIIYLGVMTTSAGPKGEAQPGVTLLCLDPRDGVPLGRAELPPNTSPEETVRELVVLDQGGVLYLHRTDEGAQLTRWDCR
jgi:hypothetical protein